MASNTGAKKRDPIKHIRDKAKAAYKKESCCYICGATEALELHHTHSLTNLFEKWAKENNYSIETDEDVLELRETFIALHSVEIYDDVFTLCLKHHQMLHGIYGKAPALHTAKKQAVWINTQRNKINGLVNQEASDKYSAETKSSTGTDSLGVWSRHRVGTVPNSFTSLRTI